MNVFGAPRRGSWMVITVLVALALAALACGGGTVTQPTPVPPTAAPATAIPATAIPATQAPAGTTGGDTGGVTGGETGATGGINMVVDNQSGVSICYLYITEADNPEWGDDQLGASDVVPSGSTYNITDIPPGTYDLLAEDCDHNVISWNYQVTLNAGDTPTLTVSGSPDQLVMENTSSAQICAVYISPANSDSWGRSQLNSANPIEPGATRNIAVAPGTWDLRSETCSGESIDRFGEELGGTTTWTLTD